VYTVPSAALVPGALTAYDLPDLLASLAPRRVAAVTPVDQAQEVLGQAAASEHFRYTVSHYRTRGAGANFRIPTQAEEGLVEAVVWGAQ
jgi:hypothetical protein